MMHSPHTLDDLTRRNLLRRGAAALAGLGFGSSFLAGCASSNKAATLPDVNWPGDALDPRAPAPRPRPAPAVAKKPALHLPGGVISRSEWAQGNPIAARMTPAKPYWRITIHHDGIDSFTTTDRSAAAARLEQIRQAHLNRSGEPFGDIGYHYLIDPAGRVWQGRPLDWQGAHVRATNDGNLGVCCLGNFQQQRPTEAQLAALDRFVATQMARYSVPVSRVYTHRELGPTVCPGNNLQPFINDSRRSGALAQA